MQNQTPNQEISHHGKPENSVSWHYQTPDYYGADFDIAGLVDKLKKAEIVVPKFHHEWVWKPSDSSRFIESLLLGFPVPGICLAYDSETHKYLVIDGQQRLKSLLFFYEGKFNPALEVKKPQIFKLTHVIPKYAGLTYADLPVRDQDNLDSSLIHATIVKQDFLKDDDTTLYHLYERLNRTKPGLEPQEIRGVVYSGKLMELVNSLNDYSTWRSVVGKVDKRDLRLKDQELILRFLALYFAKGEYQPPLLEFLNVFTKVHRNPSQRFLTAAEKIFKQTLTAFYAALGERVFRRSPKSAMNAAIFDSMMYGLAYRIKPGKIPDGNAISRCYEKLLTDAPYTKAIIVATDEDAEVLVSTRLAKAKQFFAAI